MRIVGGKFAGRDLTSPGKTRVRPTSEHVRATLLDHLRADLPDARILDLFAGTGALGLEALSRGSKTADFVEMNASSLHALKANVVRFKLKARTRVFVKDAIHFADALAADRYDICFADPPYESKQLDWLIRVWHERRFSRVLAVEHAKSHEIPRGQVTLTFETTCVTIFRAARVPIDATAVDNRPTSVEAPNSAARRPSSPTGAPARTHPATRAPTKRRRS